MTRKLILFVTLLFSIYNLIVLLLPYNPSFFPNFTSQNIVKAEEFIYSKNESSVIIVGSSLSANLDLKNIYNLSLIGEGPATGLEIINKTKNSPSVLVIETNYLMRNCNNKFIETIFNEPTKSLKAIFPALQEKNQPIIRLYNFFSQPHDSKSLHKKKILEFKKSEYYQKYSEKKVTEFISAFNNTVKQLKQNRIKIIFLTMPIDTSLCCMPRYNQEFKLWKEIADQNELLWIRPKGNYQTSDGEHLLPEEIHKLSNALEKEFMALSNDL